MRQLYQRRQRRGSTAACDVKQPAAPQQASLAFFACVRAVGAQKELGRAGRCCLDQRLTVRFTLEDREAIEMGPDATGVKIDVRL